MSVSALEVTRVLNLLMTAGSATDFALALLSSDERRLIRRCALARRFNSALVDDIIRPAVKIGSEAVPFERLKALPGVSSDPGRPGWYCIDPENRLKHERAWLDPPTGDDDALGEEAFGELNGRLADWFANHRDGELEELYHRLISDPRRAAAEFRVKYRQAESIFDLARCESLLGILDQRQRFLSRALASVRTDARGLLRARSAVADDHYRTARYLERRPLLDELEKLVSDRSRFILNIHGAGGSGKTMFLRWLSARYCLPKQIPWRAWTSTFSTNPKPVLRRGSSSASSRNDSISSCAALHSPSSSTVSSKCAGPRPRGVNKGRGRGPRALQPTRKRSGQGSPACSKRRAAGRFC
jgi:hypothetical protein